MQKTTFLLLALLLLCSCNNKEKQLDKAIDKAVACAELGTVEYTVTKLIIANDNEMGIETVAVYSEADENSLHVKYADEAFLIGQAHPTKSYLNSERILEVADMAGADAIHPGYGFLAEKAAFSGAVKKAGFAFIGPSEETIRMMGSKLDSKQAMHDAGVPVLPWTQSTSHEEAKAFAESIGYPVIVKASAGGGGIGMTIVNN